MVCHARTGHFILLIEQENSVSLWKYYITIKCIFRGMDMRRFNQLLKWQNIKAELLKWHDDSYQGQKGIFGRITKSFFNDLGKQIAQ